MEVEGLPHPGTLEAEVSPPPTPEGLSPPTTPEGLSPQTTPSGPAAWTGVEPIPFELLTPKRLEEGPRKPPKTEARRRVRLVAPTVRTSADLRNVYHQQLWKLSPEYPNDQPGGAAIAYHRPGAGMVYLMIMGTLVEKGIRDDVVDGLYANTASVDCFEELSDPPRGMSFGGVVEVAEGLARYVEELSDREKISNVVVWCRSGIHRSVTVVLAFMMARVNKKDPRESDEEYFRRNVAQLVIARPNAFQNEDHLSRASWSGEHPMRDLSFTWKDVAIAVYNKLQGRELEEEEEEEKGVEEMLFE